MSDITTIQNKLITLKNYAHLDEQTSNEISDALLKERNAEELENLLEKVEKKLQKDTVAV